MKKVERISDKSETENSQQVLTITQWATVLGAIDQYRNDVVQHQNTIYSKCKTHIDFTRNYDLLALIGTALVAPDRGVILLNRNSKKMKSIYQDFLKNFANKNELTVDIFSYALEMSRLLITDSDKQWQGENQEIIIGKNKENLPIGKMGDITTQKKGVCHLHAFLIAFLLGEYYKNNTDDTSVYYYRDSLFDKETQRHKGDYSWVVCRTKDALYIIDPMQQKQLNLKELIDYLLACALYDTKIIDLIFTRTFHQPPNIAQTLRDRQSNFIPHLLNLPKESLKSVLAELQLQSFFQFSLLLERVKNESQSDQLEKYGFLIKFMSGLEYKRSIKELSINHEIIQKRHLFLSTKKFADFTDNEKYIFVIALLIFSPEKQKDMLLNYTNNSEEVRQRKDLENFLEINEDILPVSSDEIIHLKSNLDLMIKSDKDNLILGSEKKRGLEAISSFCKGKLSTYIPFENAVKKQNSQANKKGPFFQQEFTKKPDSEIPPPNNTKG